MSVIENPDVKGIGCNFCELCCRFPQYASTNPPCMPNYHLGAAPVGGACWPVGMNENFEENKGEIKIFPNPMSSEFTLSSNEMLFDVSIEVMSITGETVIHKTYTSGGYFTIDISDKASGVYLVEIKSNKGIKLIKLVKE